jgi:hypothetical protein
MSACLSNAISPAYRATSANNVGYEVREIRCALADFILRNRLKDAITITIGNR